MANKTALFSRHQSGGIFTINDESQTTGNIFFVNSATGTDSAGYGISPDAPFASINYASTQCRAGFRDRLYVMPSHVETVATAGGLTLAVADVDVYGISKGATRPTVNFSATIGTCVISAANVYMKNILFTGGINAVAAPITVSGAEVTLEDCEYRDVTGSCTIGLTTTAGANKLLLKNFRYRGAAGAGTVSGIALVGGANIVIDGLYMDGNFSHAGIEVKTTATVDLEVRNVVFRERNSADIFLKDTITASTGMIGPNISIRLSANTTNIQGAITGATFVVFDPVYVVNNAGEKAMLIDWTASTDA